MAPVYSYRFLSSAGLLGTGPSYTVPSGFVAVVKCVTFYGSPGAFPMTAFLEDDVVGAALIADDWGSGDNHSTLWYGAAVFEEAQGFHFQVDQPGGTAGADVTASGYLLSA